ncbi:hypothetical protein GCM10025867_09350 [Frondihabitans sucicola]|uniref:Uncharacterized protein n=1 Tax=Frondihabitans sucicola TaxID=1268041 RepID=A0ABN6XUT6_9MICO|nr:hypothetical protein GCM10025867_09350 [Frondihabitans sucicola]
MARNTERNLEVADDEDLSESEDAPSDGGAAVDVDETVDSVSPGATSAADTDTTPEDGTTGEPAGEDTTEE